MPVGTDIQEAILRASPNPAMNFLKGRSFWRERDLLTVGNAVFNLETIFKTGLRTDQVTIPLSRESLVRIDVEALREDLEDLILNVLLQRVEVRFKPAPRPGARSDNPKKGNGTETVCLFSGGVDSYSGILNSFLNYGAVAGVSVIHGDQPWASRIIDRLTSVFRAEFDISIYKLYAPPMVSRGYSQLRGFLYCLYGAIYVNLLEARRLLITEVGPTMYQPQFSPYDQVTMTTHPFVLRKVKRVLANLLGREISLVLPYENMTKSEVVAASPLPQGLPLTHSCVTLRFGRNEGCCFGCIVRRLGFLTAGREDSPYTYDPIGNSTAEADNLITLLRFSHDVLLDFRRLLPQSRDNIENYNKRDLFERHALDTFASLYEYQNTVGPLNPDLEAIYRAGLNRIGVPRLERRIAKVRRPTFKPNFDRVF